MTTPFHNRYWIESDRILCGDHPLGVPGVGEPVAMSSLLRSGIRVFVDLTSEGEMPSYSDLARKTAGDLAIDPASLSFHRLPILRGSSPHHAGHVRAMLRTIRLARVGERPVYLHCAKGHGRTGMIAGCLYRELWMFAPPAALSQSPLSLHDYGNPDGRKAGFPQRFGETPGTPCQRDFVLHWLPHRSVNLREVQAGILGAAAAEALTAADSPNRRREPLHLSMILAMIDGLYLPGQYDDSWTERPLDPASLEANALRWANSRRDRAFPNNGGGACHLPCLLPLALARCNCADLIERVGSTLSLVGAVGLSDDVSRFCAAFYCLVVSDLVHAGSIEAATHFAWEALKGRPEFDRARAEVAGTLEPQRIFEKPRNGADPSGNAAGILVAALWAVHQGGDYRTSVETAAALGGRDGTIASLAGGLAGIIHGEAAIPKAWLAGIPCLADVGRRSEEFRSYIGQENCLLIGGLPG
jgi:hypothetical protein